MKDNFKNITIAVSILINVLQFISSEAREWYSVMRQSEPSMSNNKMIVENKGIDTVERIYPKESKRIAEGVK